jgi:hypothetical protein
VRALEAERCTTIFTDSASGKGLEGQSELGRAIAALTPGDVSALAEWLAIKAGKRMGRKPKLTAHQQRSARTRVANGESTRDVAKGFAVHHATIATSTSSP